MKNNQFIAGQKWVVLKERSALFGKKPSNHSGYKPWSKKLTVGTILHCCGISETINGGPPIVKWSDKDGKYLADDCEFGPSFGQLNERYPALGYLKLL